MREEELKAVKKELDEILGQSENSVAGLHKELSDALTKHSKCSVERRGGRGREREGEGGPTPRVEKRENSCEL